MSTNAFLGGSEKSKSKPKRSETKKTTSYNTDEPKAKADRMTYNLLYNNKYYFMKMMKVLIGRNLKVFHQ